LFANGLEGNSGHKKPCILRPGVFTP
jgi:hypothetical protein